MAGTRSEQAEVARDLVWDALKGLNHAIAEMGGALATLGEAIVAWPLLDQYIDMPEAEYRKYQVETEAEMLIVLLGTTEAWRDGPLQDGSTE